MPAGPDASSPTARVLLSPRMDTCNPPSRTRKLRVMSVNVPGVATMGGKLELHDEPLVVGFLRGLDEGQDIADYRVGIRQGRPDGVASDNDGGAGPIDPRAYANESGLASVRGEVRSLYPAFGSASSHRVTVWRRRAAAALLGVCALRPGVSIHVRQGLA